ncbi:MAG TPA: thioredoxin-like domain-containing protein [Candidatus Polarisedimenticolia bacterium]|nr:thioredoxin-like domain-containing protein [Candidatus Polarisedimenticolia bacterium]
MRPPLVHAPEFPRDLTWINTRRPLTLSTDLRGRVTVLDFWTYCCINCLHVLPVLARLERRFAAAPVAILGVHSAKFLSEKDPVNIRNAVRRYGVTHPVVVDSEHDLWQRFAVRAWPTLVVLDAQGYVRDTLSGEVEEEPLAAMIEVLLGEGRKKGVLAAGPIEAEPDRHAETGFLRFPGRIHVFQDRLFVADSGHHRIVVSDLEGKVLQTVGEGGVGAHDGSATSASFNHPQGLAVSGNALFVADTGNHLLRSVDLRTLEVTTRAGTGEKGTSFKRCDPARPREVSLRSPWGLLSIGAQILIAMAGSHQIWIFDSEKELLAPWAGSGREDHLDGKLMEAAFAQPSGLAQAGRLVLVADSEDSSVRAIDLLEERVRTIVGRGLFDFGDSVGAPSEVLLQHPLDVAVGDNVLYVADTYNNKIKEIAFGSMRTRTLFGDGSRSTMDEPGGLAVAGAHLLVADTNHHRILRGDPSTLRLEELVLRP